MDVIHGGQLIQKCLNYRLYANAFSDECLRITSSEWILQLLKMATHLQFFRSSSDHIHWFLQNHRKSPLPNEKLTSFPTAVTIDKTCNYQEKEWYNCVVDFHALLKKKKVSKETVVITRIHNCSELTFKAYFPEKCSKRKIFF